uniref:HOOK domain-containing protein n=1 Tax=Caenorhabditis tropicalis TaxID=1561998 RepID=A0A1I7V3W0_9PELO
MDDLSIRVKQLENENHELKKQIAQNDVQREIAESIMNMTAAISRDFYSALEQLDGVKKEKIELGKEVNDLKEELETQSEELKNLQRFKKAVEESNEKTVNVVIQSDHSEEQALIAELHLKIEKIEKARDHQAEVNQQLLAEIQNIQQKQSENSMQTVGNLQEELNKAESKIDAMEKIIAQQKEEFEEKQRTFETMEASLTRMWQQDNAKMASMKIMLEGDTRWAEYVIT